MDKHPEAKMIGITCDHHQSIYPPVIKVTMENTLFIGDFPIETPISGWSANHPFISRKFPYIYICIHRKINIHMYIYICIYIYIYVYIYI